MADSGRVRDLEAEIRKMNLEECVRVRVFDLGKNKNGE